MLQLPESTGASPRVIPTACPDRREQVAGDKARRDSLPWQNQVLMVSKLPVWLSQKKLYGSKYSHSCHRSPPYRASLSSRINSSVRRRRRAHTGPRGPCSTPCTSCQFLEQNRGAYGQPDCRLVPPSLLSSPPRSPRGRKCLYFPTAN